MPQGNLGCPDCGQPLGMYHVPSCPKAHGQAGIEVTSVGPDAYDLLYDLRNAGWRVGIHNDYTFRGATFTFWLLTFPGAGVFVKGEGPTDLIAIRQCIAEIKARDLTYVAERLPSRDKPQPD